MNNINQIVTLRNLRDEELGTYCIIESKLSCTYTPEWSGRSEGNVQGYIGENDPMSNVRAGNHGTSHTDSFAAIDPESVEIGVQKEKARILEEIEDTLVCWSYPESDVAPDVRCVLMNLGMHVVNSDHTDEGVEKVEEWLIKAEKMVDIEYAEMEAHFANLRKKNRRKKLTIISTLLLVFGAVYSIIRKYCQ